MISGSGKGQENSEHAGGLWETPGTCGEEKKKQGWLVAPRKN